MHDAPPFVPGPSDADGSADPDSGRVRQFRRGRTDPRTAARIVGAFVLAIAGAFAAMRPLAGPNSVPTAQPGGLAGPTVGSGLEIGRHAPEFATDDGRTSLLADMDGRAIRLDGFRGRPVWIVFWAAWCVPCREEAVDIQAAYHAHRDAGLVVLAIDVQEPAAAARAYVDANALDYTIGLDPRAEVAHLLGVHGLPAHLFLDSDGVIRDRYAGQLTSELMEDHLTTILSP